MSSSLIVFHVSEHALVASTIPFDSGCAALYVTRKSLRKKLKAVRARLGAAGSRGGGFSRAASRSLSRCFLRSSAARRRSSFFVGGFCSLGGFAFFAFASAGFFFVGEAPAPEAFEAPAAGAAAGGPPGRSEAACEAFGAHPAAGAGPARGRTETGSGSGGPGTYAGNSP